MATHWARQIWDEMTLSCVASCPESRPLYYGTCPRCNEINS